MRKDIIKEEHSLEQIMRTKRMLLIGGIMSIVMLFASLMSAYVVSRGGASFWVNITIPTSLWISTLLIIMSSVTVHLATRSADRNDTPKVKMFLTITLILGIAFGISQYYGFRTLSDRGLTMTGNFLQNLKGEYNKDYYITNSKDQVVIFDGTHYIDPDDPSKSKIIDNKITELKNSASTYMIFIIFLHIVHVLGGLLYLLFLVLYSNIKDISVFNYLKTRQIAFYWHFVDVLWILLLLFLFFIH